MNGHPPVRQWKRSDVTTELLCYAICRHGVGALDILHAVLGIPAKVLIAAVHRDTIRGFVNWGVSPWRPFLEARGRLQIAPLRERSREMQPGLTPGGVCPDGGCDNPPVGVKERQHRVEIITLPDDPGAMPNQSSVVGGDELVAAALRAFANKIDPPPPPVVKPPLHR